MSSTKPEWDSLVKGLHIKTTETGKRSYFLYYRTRQGRQRRPKIGGCEEITLPEARRRAKAILERVAVGEDPKGAWDGAKAEASVQDVFEMAWAEHWSKDRFQESGWAREARRNFENHIRPAFGNLKLSELTPKLVREWHSRFESTPYAGNRSLEILSKILRFAEEKELKAAGSNPCSLVKSHPERKRKRFATEDEVRAVGRILVRESETDPAGAAFLFLLMFTGSRPRAIERARWEDVAFIEAGEQTFGVLTFSGKTTEETGEDETVIIPPQVMEILSKLPRSQDGTLTGIKMPRALWERVRKEAGCTDLWARDWRRTFATVGLSHGVGSGTIGELLNHRSAETTKIYAKLAPTARVEAVSIIAGKMARLLQDAG